MPSRRLDSTEEGCTPGCLMISVAAAIALVLVLVWIFSPVAEALNR